MATAAKKTASPVGIKTNPELLKKGSIVNIDVGGRTLTGLEVLDYDERFIKFRWDMRVSPMTEIVLVPWEKVGVLGLTQER